MRQVRSHGRERVLRHRESRISRREKRSRKRGSRRISRDGISRDKKVSERLLRVARRFVSFFSELSTLQSIARRTAFLLRTRGYIIRAGSRMRLSHRLVGSSNLSIGNRKKWGYQCRLIQLKPVLTRISVVISNSGATEPPIRHPRPGLPQTSQRSFLPSRFVYRDILSFQQSLAFHTHVHSYPTYTLTYVAICATFFIA